MINYEEEYLAHHGTKGQRWGVRRFQNYDGSLTAAGKLRYSVGNVGRSISKKVDPKQPQPKPLANKSCNTPALVVPAFFRYLYEYIIPYS